MAEQVTPLLQLQKSERAIHEFDVPEELQSTGITSFGVHQLTTGEEQMALKRARGDSYSLAYELAKQSLALVNGAPVKLADGSADQAIEKMGPKLRQLLLTAYGEVSTVKEDSVDAFLKSRRVKVG